MKALEKFVIFGINHDNLSLLEREAFVVDFKPHKKLREFISEKRVTDGILLSTCLRNEFYIWEELIPIDEFFFNVEGLFIKRGREALEHLLEVTCGFQSAIPGEEQILSQVKKAYMEKLEKGERPSPLNTLFNKAIALGKKFRADSRINENSVSVEALAIKESERLFGDLTDKNIFIVGAGEIASSLVKILNKKNCHNISVIKRKKSNINLEVNYYSFDEKFILWENADIVYSTTSAPHLIFEFDEVKNLKNRPRILVDFAVPRDIDFRIGELRNHTLLNLEDLNFLAGQSFEKRKEICINNKEIIDLGIEKILEWFHRRGL